MIHEQDLKNFFTENRPDIPDNGFSKQVRQRLPARKSIFLQLVTPVCTIVGFSLMVSIIGFSTIETQLLRLINAIAHLQMPPVDSIITYLVLLATISYVGFTVAETE